MLVIKNINPLFLKLNNHPSFKREMVYFILIFVLTGFLLSITQVFGESPDYSQYEYFFDLVRSEGLDVLIYSRFEHGFSIFAFVLTTLFTINVVVYSLIVVAAMLLKGWAISAYSSSKNIFLVVTIFYLVRYFPLHELTQIRGACGISLTLAGAIFLWKECFFRGILLCALAVTFHMSTMAIIPMFFLVKLTKRKRIIFIATVVFILIYTYTEKFSGYLANSITVFDNYQTAGYGDTRPNPFAVQLLIDWAMIFAAFILWDKLSQLMKRIILLQLIGMMIFYGGFDFPVISHRIRELYSVFWIFFVAHGLQNKGTKLVTYGFVFVCFVFYGYMFFLSGKFFH